MRTGRHTLIRLGLIVVVLLASCTQATALPPTTTPPPSPTLIATITAAPTLTSLPTPTPTFAVQRGRITLIFDLLATEQPNSAFDLDKILPTQNSEADVELFVTCGSDCFNIVRPINGAQVFDWDQGDLNLEDCNKHHNEFRETSIPDVFSGKQFCLLTNRNRSGLMIIDKVIYEQPATSHLEISFVVETIP